MSNQILPFCATDTGTNLLSQVDYNASTDRTSGNKPGIASAKLVNKALRQSAFIASNFAQWIANKLNQNVVDDANDAALLAQIYAALAPNNSVVLENLTLAASVAANALTISVKTQAGTDPSATDVAYVSFRNSTLATGTFTRIAITGALSIVVPSGTTLGMTSAQPEILYLYLLNNAGTPELAVSVTPLFDPAFVYTSTAISGGTSRTTLYSTTSRSNVAVTLIGKIGLTEATAGTYATAPSMIATRPVNPPLLFNSYSEVNTGNGYGSTNTIIRKYSFDSTVGSDITYALSASLGSSWTINTAGRYFIQRNDSNSGASCYFGVSKNATVGTAIDSLTPFSARLAMAGITSSLYGACYWEGDLKPGDIIRAHDNAGLPCNSSDNTSTFRIIRVG